MIKTLCNDSPRYTFLKYIFTKDFICLFIYSLTYLGEGVCMPAGGGRGEGEGQADSAQNTEPGAGLNPTTQRPRPEPPESDAQQPEPPRHP